MSADLLRPSVRSTSKAGRLPRGVGVAVPALVDDVVAGGAVVVEVAADGVAAGADVVAALSATVGLVAVGVVVALESGAFGGRGVVVVSVDVDVVVASSGVLLR